MLSIRRINYLDYIKGFAILLVILGHIYYYDNPIKIFIYSFHMPLFFIISGFLSNNKSLDIKTTICNKFKSLIIPYIMFGCGIIFLKLIINNGITGEIKSYILYFLTGTGMDALWFLPALFIIDIIYCLLKNSKLNTLLKIPTIIVLFLVGLYGKNIHTNIVLVTLYRSLIGLGFFMLGHYTFNFIKKLNVSYITILILLIITVILGLKNGCVDLWSLDINNKILYITCSITGSLSVILFFKKISNESNDIKILRYCGFNSLIIMSTHQFILEIINKITRVTYYDTKLGIGIFIIVMLIEIPIIYVINRYLPFVLGKFNKKENVKVVME